MKKLLVLSVVVLGLCSFAHYEKSEGNFKQAEGTWIYKCSNGRSGSFNCPACSTADAGVVASWYCNL